MDFPCECQLNTDDPLNLSYPKKLSNIDDESKVAEKMVVDFGKVAVFGKYTKTISIKNMNREDVASYRIKRNVVFDFYNHSFDLNIKEGFVKANEEFIKLKITYLPTIPLYKDVGCFEFVDSGFNIVNILAKGEAKGPQLTTSTNVIRFFLHPPKKKTKQIFEIKNNSDIPAEFIFDLDKNQKMFQVKPRKGLIVKHVYITVFFSAKSRGVFSEQLTCYVRAHRPITVDLFALVTKDGIDLKNMILQPYQPPNDESPVYTSCARNGSKGTAPVFLSRSSIDFGRLFKSSSGQGVGMKPGTKRQTSSLMNNMKNYIEVFWAEDDNVFCVYPKRTKIPPNQSLPFEFYFTPPDNYFNYNRRLTAQIYWPSEKETLDPCENICNIPLTTTIALQGNSFPEEAFVITNVQIIPPRITFPVCLPEDVATQNFIIRNVGPVSVMYKLVAPYSTNMVLKPMVGVVEDFVIIQAQLRTCEKNYRQFFETWHLVLNGQEEKKLTITLSGICAVPSIQIGDENAVVLSPIQTFMYGTESVSLRNTSLFHLRYRIDTGESSYIQMEPMEANLDPYDESTITITYTTIVCSLNKTKAKVYFQTLRRLQERVGHTYETEFTIYTENSYAKLCATPSTHNFGIVQWGEMIESQFHAFNFGDIPVYFKMICSNRSYNFDCFEVIPSSGEVKPGQKLKMQFRGCVKSQGENEISVEYANMSNPNSGVISIGSKPIELYKFAYDCQFPRLQFEDVVEHDFGPLFNKNHMWEFLNLGRLNDLLAQISEEETETVNMTLPEFEVGHDVHYVTLSIENTTNIETTIKLKRKKICDCPLTEVRNTFNTTKNMYDCPHREVLNLEMSETTFYKNSSRLLTISVKYSIPGETKMAYTLDLGDARIIELAFHINAIPENVGKISCYRGNYSVFLTNVAMSIKIPPIQTYWLYNNTRTSVNYEMDTDEVEMMCRKEGFQIFRIVNPSGEIEPFSAWPLMIKFHPIEIKEYYVSIPIYFGSSEKILRIRGNGRHSKKASEFLLNKVTRVCTATHKIPAAFSTDYLTVEPLLLWNSTEQIIFIKNITKDRIIQYLWGEAGIRDVVKVTVANKYGTLKPKESHTILIKISSYNEACITDISLPCTLMDCNQMYLYEKSVALYQEKAREIDGQFTLGGNGEVKYLKNDVIVQDKPQPSTISISIDINITHAMDLDVKESSKDLFSCSPQNELDVDVARILERYANFNKDSHPKGNADGFENTEIVRTVMGQLISDVVFSKKLEKLLEFSVDKTPLYYNQVTLDDQISSNRVGIKEPLNEEAIKEMRETEIRKFFSRPKLPVVSETLKNLILDGIQGTFQLGVSYPAEYDDKKLQKEVELLLPVCNDCACKINKK